MIVVHFDRSEAVADSYRLPAERVTVQYDATDGAWAQLTYDTLRDQKGDVIAAYDGVADVWFYRSQPFSDIVIEFIG